MSLDTLINYFMFMSLKDSIKRVQRKEHITQDELLRRLGCSRSSLMETASVEAQNAFQLAFGNGSAYRDNSGGTPDRTHTASCEDKNLEKFLPWIRKFPIRALQNMGLIPVTAKGASLVRAVFRFMQIGNIAGFENYYGFTLHSANPQTHAAWIRLGELRVKQSNVVFAPDHNAILSGLKFLRTNSILHRRNIRKIACEVLHNCGIEVIEVEPFLTASTPTCAFYWRGDRPVIQFPTTPIDDSKFLEALFHAVAHLLYHPKRTSCLQLGTLAQCAAIVRSSIETEAEKFAQDMLLSEAEECELICCGHFAEPRCIQYFSGLFHVRPGILVERLQQQGKIRRRTPLNDFKIAV